MSKAVYQINLLFKNIYLGHLSFPRAKDTLKNTNLLTEKPGVLCSILTSRPVAYCRDEIISVLKPCPAFKVNLNKTDETS